MNIYEIDARMTELIDPETGEVLDFDAFEALAMERDTKIDNMALWIKDLTAETDALDKEIKTLTDRKAAVTRKKERLSAYLQNILQGEKRKTSKYVISYRQSVACEITDETEALHWLQAHGYMDCVSTKVSVSKSGVKDLLKTGREVAGAELVVKQNMTIK